MRIEALRHFGPVRDVVRHVSEHAHAGSEAQGGAAQDAREEGAVLQHQLRRTDFKNI